MKKRTGIVVVLITLILTGLMYFTAIQGWGPTGTGAASNIHTGLDLSGGVSITYETDEAMPSKEDMDDTIMKLQKRVDGYSTEAQVYQEGANRINVEIPGVSDANEILEDLGTPGSLYFIAEKDAEGNANFSYYQGYGYFLMKTIDELEADGSIICTGADVVDAQGGVQPDQQTGNNEYVVSLEFTKEGTAKFAEATKTAYENSESIAIYYDGQLISVPRVSAVITDGKAIIEGQTSIEEAQNLASYIRIGGLSLTLNEIRSNVVGASLGQEAIKTSLMGGAIGLGLICLIMIIVYLVPGVVAAVSLIIYTALMLLLLNAFDLTLTLPGIAGIILSIGMAVDANVIIYTRIREEIAAGTSVRSAIRAGFSKAMSAIIDGNVTTLIAAAVLGFLGTGTIKGFAMTLALGVVLSLFTACVLSRLLVNAVYALGIHDEKFWARRTKTPAIRFVANRLKYAILAVVVIVIGFAAMGIHAAGGEHSLNFSLDFLGGTSTTVDFNEDMTLQELDDQVKPYVMEITGDANVVMQKVVNANQVIIKTRTLNNDERTAMTDVLTENFGIEESAITAESISATVGNEMRRDAVLAVVIAVILMLLYIFIRFRDIRFATAAVIALCHDVLVTLTAYALLRISVGNAFIAVMLTILGYSINSTIVIFDRIREKLPLLKRGGRLADLVDSAVNQTLTRSIFTNLTTFASILVLYIVGVASIKEFTLPMMVGIVAGTFSSVFLTGALWFVLRTRVGKDKDFYSAAVLPLPAAGADAEASPAVEEAVVKASAQADGKASSVRAGNPKVIRKKKKK
ncbi:MAG: protein translocase subunit SecD [Lachnospiraceae bacterium]|nr:protein translocase subunit SecD [Lachnospiraceae bacterium]